MSTKHYHIVERLRLTETEALRVVRGVQGLVILDKNIAGQYFVPSIITNQHRAWLQEAVCRALPTQAVPSMDSHLCQQILRATASFLNAEAIGTVREELVKAGFVLEKNDE